MAGLLPFHSYDVWHFDASSGFHDHTNDDLALIFSNRTPIESSDVDHGDAQEIGFGFGYEGPISILQFESIAGPIYTIHGGTDIVVVAKGGTIGPFGHLILQNNDLVFGLEERLLCYWSLGETINILDGGSFAILWQGFPAGAPFNPATLSIF